jgi:hypothetical protein
MAYNPFAWVGPEDEDTLGFGYLLAMFLLYLI